MFAMSWFVILSDRCSISCSRVGNISNQPPLLLYRRFSICKVNILKILVNGFTNMDLKLIVTHILIEDCIEVCRITKDYVYKINSDIEETWNIKH